MADGIIPAYAGSTDLSVVYGSLDTDHPRVCGEHDTIFEEYGVTTGSSPRMRGARPLWRRRQGRGRIIPAYAGSTTAGPWTPGDDKDHPRVCGEHPLSRQDAGMWAGSSPRMRGAHLVGPGDLERHRIIPAYAGSTQHHSRLSGHHRIIPAYAGSTRRRWGSSPSIRDHPRVCGEHLGFGQDLTTAAGSSPRMRGAPGVAWGAGACTGIILAYAGSTAGRYQGGPDARNHPRVCGEHYTIHSFFFPLRGSSPRMRGAHLWQTRRV